MAVAEILISNPVGYNMDVLAERLGHVRNIVDLSTWRVILDIGAMDGWEGLNMAKVFPDARVYAFEASKANCDRCVKTYMTQPYSVRSRIALSQVALAEKTGPLDFFAVDEDKALMTKGKVNTGMGSILELVDPDMWPWEHNAQARTQVSGYSLDDWCREAGVQSVDAIWMDVQGGELHVLKGGDAALSNVQVVMTEAGVKPYYHGHTLKPDIDAYLASKGFFELESARQQAHEYEVNAIYVNSRFAR
jgi:FkbM family methyltransferase